LTWRYRILLGSAERTGHWFSQKFEKRVPDLFQRADVVGYDSSKSLLVVPLPLNPAELAFYLVFLASPPSAFSAVGPSVEIGECALFWNIPGILLEYLDAALFPELGFGKLRVASSTAPPSFK
jgi:hypothetical protein